MKNPFLIGEIVYLRPIEYEDLDGNYVQWLNDSEVCKHSRNHIFPYIKEEARDYIKKVYSSEEVLFLAVALKENDLHIGNIALQDINLINRSANFTILLGEKSCWGKGYAKEASVLLVQHGFTALGLYRIYCGTSSKNIPMQKLAYFLGMVEEGCFRKAFYKDGEMVDWLMYGVLREEFFVKFDLIKNFI